MQSVDCAQFLNTTSLPLSFNHLATASAPAPVIVIVPLTRMYAFLQSHKLKS